MSTAGNLELRLADVGLVAGIPYDGYEVYKTIVTLAQLYKKHDEVSENELRGWFQQATEEELKRVDTLNPIYHVPAEEVIVDPWRRILMLTGDESSFSLVSPGFEFSVRGALEYLREEQDYLVIPITSLAVREHMREESTD